MLEKALPQTVAITLHRPSTGQIHLYDLIDRKKIDFKQSANAHVNRSRVAGAGWQDDRHFAGGARQGRISTPKAVKAGGTAPPFRFWSPTPLEPRCRGDAAQGDSD